MHHPAKKFRAPPVALDHFRSHLGECRIERLPRQRDKMVAEQAAMLSAGNGQIRRLLPPSLPEGQAAGPRRGYFAWHCKFDGTQLDPGSASDGEEWFAMALFPLKTVGPG